MTFSFFNFNNMFFNNGFQCGFPMFNWGFAGFPWVNNFWGVNSNNIKTNDVNIWDYLNESSNKTNNSPSVFTNFWEQMSNNYAKNNFSWQNISYSSKPSTGKKNYTYSGGLYANMNRLEALKKAEKDPKLEKLTGGNGWSISEASFINDIPYAKKGTGLVLAKAARLTGENLVVTSALGTKDSPHAKNSGSASHYNSDNPKLDLGGGLSPEQANSLKAKLDSTGLFSRIMVESDGATAHLDVQIADSAFKSLDTVA